MGGAIMSLDVAPIMMEKMKKSPIKYSQKTSFFFARSNFSRLKCKFEVEGKLNLWSQQILHMLQLHCCAVMLFPVNQAEYLGVIFFPHTCQLDCLWNARQRLVLMR
jgi:hypothetical protein